MLATKPAQALITLHFASLVSGSKNTFPIYKYRDYVGKMDGNGSAVYLGRGIALTAAHVGLKDVIIRGKRYKSAPRSVKVFRNPDNRERADLMTFRIKIPAGDSLRSLPVLSLSKDKKLSKDKVVICGYGYTSRSTRFRSLRSVIGNGLSLNNGFSWDKPGDLVWGYAQIDNDERMWLTQEGRRTAIFYSTFLNKPYSAQATNGDSGGAAFVYNRSKNRWELGGVIVAYLGQPGVSYFGNLSMIGDISVYRNQILREVYSNNF